MALAFEAAAILTLCALALLCYATLQGYRVTLQPVAIGLANIIRRFAVTLPAIGRVGPGPWLADRIHDLDTNIVHGLGYTVRRSEAAAVGLFLGSLAMMVALAGEIRDLAHDTSITIENKVAGGARLTRKVVGRLIAASVGAASLALRRYIATAIHGLSHRIMSVVRSVAALEHALPRVEGFTRKQLRALQRRLGLLRWLAGVGSIAALGGLLLKKLHLRWLLHHKSAAALVAAGLAKLGWDWIKCDNNKAWGKKRCGLPADLFASLLEDLGLIIGAISLVEFTEEIQGLTDESVKIMRGFIREF